MPNENEGGSQATPTAEEQLGNMVNAAVSSHLKRFVEKQLPTLLEGALKPIQDKLSAAPAAQPVPDDHADTKTSKKVKEAPEFLALQAQVEQMKQNLEQANQARQASEKRSREERAYGDLRTALDGKVRKELVDTVAKVLFHADKVIEFDEAGNALFKVSKAPYAGADPEDQFLPLGAGVEEYLKSDAAKSFLPAPSQGSSAPPLQKKPAMTPLPAGRKPTTDAEKVAYASERERAAKAKLGL